MNKLLILGVPLLAALVGCTPQLKPNPNISTYYVTPGTGFYPTQLCGISFAGEACLQMRNGPKVKAVLNGNFLNWLPGLQANQTTIANSGRRSYRLAAEQAVPLLQALVDDNKQRDFERWMDDDYEDD